MKQYPIAVIKAAWRRWRKPVISAVMAPPLTHSVSFSNGMLGRAPHLNSREAQADHIRHVLRSVLQSHEFGQSHLNEYTLRQVRKALKNGDHD